MSIVSNVGLVSNVSIINCLPIKKNFAPKKKKKREREKESSDSTPPPLPLAPGLWCKLKRYVPPQKKWFLDCSDWKLPVWSKIGYALEGNLENVSQFAVNSFYLNLDTLEGRYSPLLKRNRWNLVETSEIAMSALGRSLLYSDVLFERVYYSIYIYTSLTLSPRRPKSQTISFKTIQRN